MSPDALGKASLIAAVALFALIIITLFLPYQFNPYPVFAVGITSIISVFLLCLGLFSSKA